ncbi:major facilitator superfamily domain-containing protein [Obelidium mucronatum]|nr:major facilitator superfamily domain-containing protein [Obelidium mucronatum]
MSPSPTHALLGFFLVVLATSIGSFPFQQLLITLVCQPILGTGSSYPKCAAAGEVQQTAAFWSLVFMLCDQVPTLLLLLVAGPLVDGKLGRRGAMLLGAGSVALSAVQFLLASVALNNVEYVNVDVALGVLVLIAIVAGFAGSVILFRVAAVAYISDISPVDQRTKYFMLVDAAFALALIAGPVLGGVLTDTVGFFITFLVMLSVAVALLVYLALFVKESRPATSHAISNSSSSGNNNQPLTRILIDSVATTIKTIRSMLRYKAATALLIVMTIMTLLISGFQVLYLYSPANRFGWTALDTGKFAVIAALQTIIWLVLLLPKITQLAIHTFHLPNKTIAEIRILQTGVLAAMLGCIAYGQATTGTQFITSSIIGVMSCFANPNIRSLLSVLVPPEFQGRLFSAIQILESCAMIVSGVSLNSVYRVTVDVAPEFCFYVVAGAMGVAFVVSVVGVTREGVEDMTNCGMERDLGGDGVVGGGGGGGAPIIPVTHCFIKRMKSNFDNKPLNSQKKRDNPKMPVPAARPRSFRLDAKDSLHSSFGNTAKITWYTPETHHSVIVTGTFDNWSKSVSMTRSDELDAYVADVNIPNSQLKPGEKLMYKFIVDGEWMIDSEEPIESDPSGNINNVFVVSLSSSSTNTTTSSSSSTHNFRELSKKKSCISVVLNRSAPLPTTTATSSTHDAIPVLPPTQQPIEHSFENTDREGGLLTTRLSLDQPSPSNATRRTSNTNHQTVSKKRSYLVIANRSPPPLPQLPSNNNTTATPPSSTPPPNPEHLKPQEKEEQQQPTEPTTTTIISIPYNREAVIELAQFLLDHLETPPYFVDPTRIFMCVESCYRDFKKETVYDGERYNLVLFLLAAARAATWFTEKQRGWIGEWKKDLSQV